MGDISFLVKIFYSLFTNRKEPLLLVHFLEVVKWDMWRGVSSKGGLGVLDPADRLHGNK